MSAADQRISQLTLERFSASRNEVLERTNRLLAALLVIEWLAAVVASIVISPLTWAGPTGWTHPHVWGALVVGAIIASLPAAMAYSAPKTPWLRYVIAVAHMLMAGLVVHVTGGRLETHFMYFGVLAFLACYQDRSVLLLATAVAVGDHLGREFIWPQSIYGVTSTTGWRWVEHGFWLVFENAILLWSCDTFKQQMLATARQSAELEVLREREAEEAESRLRESQDEQQNLSKQRSDLQLARESEESLRISAERHAEGLDSHVKELVAAASEIGSIHDATSATVNELNESSGEIGDVTRAITSIAEQTNLLALNATIEAARAGEAGKGFAVVANEVKELAKETSSETEKIGRRVAAIRNSIDSTVEAISQTTAVISRINEIAHALGQSADAEHAQDGLTFSGAHALSSAASDSPLQLHP